MKERVIHEIKFFVVNYVVITIFGVILCLFEACRRIEFRNFENYPIWEKNVMTVANHPSLVEPVILPLMGFPWMNYPWLFSSNKVKFSLGWLKELREEFLLPKKLVPMNTPDKENFIDNILFKWIQIRSIAVDRGGGPQSRIKTLTAMSNTLTNGGRVNLFPEGTRTHNSLQKAKSATGKELGTLKEGAAWLALRTGAKIVPIWVDGSEKVLPPGNIRIPIPGFWHIKFSIPRPWHKIVITIGHPFYPKGTNRKDVTKEIEIAMLAVADEALISDSENPFLKLWRSIVANIKFSS